MNETLLQRQPDMVFSKIDDDVVMMSIDTGEYYGLKAVAGRIWELLDTPRTFEQLISILLEEFEVDPEQCRKEVAAFLDQLIEKKLVVQKSIE